MDNADLNQIFDTLESFIGFAVSNCAQFRVDKMIDA